MILLLDFRLGDDATYHAPGEKEEGKDKDEDTKSSKVNINFCSLCQLFPLSLNYLQNGKFESLFQDNNADGTSRKGDEEEGAANVRKIPIGKRFFEFYDAPFTKFWFNTVSLHS